MLPLFGYSYVTLSLPAHITVLATGPACCAQDHPIRRRRDRDAQGRHQSDRPWVERVCAEWLGGEGGGCTQAADQMGPARDGTARDVQPSTSDQSRMVDDREDGKQ